MEDAARIEAQRYIDVALREINVGNYETAAKLVSKAKTLHASADTDELLDLIEKLRIETEKSTPSEPPLNSTLPRQRKTSTTSANNNNHGSDYTQVQLDLVKKINKCTNFYQVLAVSRDATDAEIKKAYKKLALQLHPDKNRAPGAAEAFKTVGNAVALLTDDAKRKEYDESGADTLSPHNNSGFHTNNYQRYYQNNHNNHHAASFEATFGSDDISAEELFNMFFGSFPAQGRQPQRRAYQSANQRQPQEHNSHQPSLAFGLILVLILISMLSSFFTSDPVYNLTQSSKYPVRRETQHLSVPYYVRQNFEGDYQGSLGRLENSVEEDFIYTMKQNCYRERTYHEMDDLIEKLRSTSVSPTSTTADNSTSTSLLLSEISSTKDPKLFDKHELAELFLALTQSEDTKVRKEAAKCIAEITKSEVQRKKFTKREIIEAFIDCLRNLLVAAAALSSSSPSSPSSSSVSEAEAAAATAMVVDEANNLELPIQICRALGNICYLNDEARDIILELKGDVVLVQLLDITHIVDTANASQFIKVRGGLLSNYLLGGEGLAKRAMELSIMEKIQKITTIGVANVEIHEELLLNTLPLLSILTENVADLNFEPILNYQLSRILAASTDPDLAEMCLELLHYQAENDEVKLLLAKDGLCEVIYNLLEQYKNLASTSEARALMKLACELIVLILTGDDSMHFLYNSPLLIQMEVWLDSQDIDLLTTGVLALGNFARTDSHCIYMVEKKIMNKLLEVLAKNNGVKDDVRLQHALLSALRNLVIPKPNKGAVIEAGLVETILPMLEIHQPPVVFKLLGTLRMTVDGQEKLALDLLKNKTLIEQLVHWSKSSDYAGVTGESLRLMAWLIKHAYLCKIAYALPRKGDAPAEQLAEKLPTAQAYDRSSLSEFIANEGTVEAMINMLTSQHLVMQNEALIALCILCVVYLTKSPPALDATKEEDAVNLQAAFIRYEVGKKLAELIQKSSDTMTKEIVENLQNFTNLLKTSEQLVAHLEGHNINELLKSIPILTEYCTL